MIPLMNRSSSGLLENLWLWIDMDRGLLRWRQGLGRDIGADPEPSQFAYQ